MRYGFEVEGGKVIRLTILSFLRDSNLIMARGKKRVVSLYKHPGE
jgi:hypothetical protein